VNVSGFAQDTWRLAQRLTLTAGLRWELNPPPGEVDGRKPLNVVGLENPATATLAAEDDPLYQTTYLNLAPRVGAALQLGQKPRWETILRGGFGVFYDLGSGTVTNGFSLFSFQETKANVLFPIPPGQNRVAVQPDPRALPIRNGIAAIDQNLQLPYTLQWNVALQQSLGGHQGISASYVAAAGRRLLVTRRFRNPNPNFIAVSLTTNGATSDYHSLQIQYDRRFSRGLQAMASYTLAHAIDEASDDLVSFNLARGNADFDIRHNFSSAVTYNLPSPQAGGLAAAPLRNWAVDTIVRAQTGAPQTIVAGTIVDEFGQDVSVRPNLVGGVPIYLNNERVPGGRVVNRLAFQLPPAGQQGNLGRNVLRRTNLHQVDIALRRGFEVGEGMKIQFRVEAFNVLNHPNFGPLDTSLASGLFGQPVQMLNRTLGGLSQLYQIGGPRSLQFMLRLGF
jgi:hypothetical protein